MWAFLLHPVIIRPDQSCLLFKAPELPSCPIRWAELFPGSSDSSLWYHLFHRLCFSDRSLVRDWPTSNSSSTDVRGMPRPLTPSGVAVQVTPYSCEPMGSFSVWMLVEVHTQLSTGLSRVFYSISRFAPNSQDAFQSG